MIEPSESARRISSALSRFGVSLDGSPAASDPDVLTSKKGFGMALAPLVERMNGEIDATDIPEATKRLLKLRTRQLDEVGQALIAGPPSDRFEPPELAVMASLIDLTVTMFAAAAGKEYRAESP